jgi:hypothetical protein
MCRLTARRISNYTTELNFPTVQFEIMRKIIRSQNKVKSLKFVKQNPKKIIGTKSTNKNDNLPKK